MGAKKVIVDESAFVKTEVFTQLVTPLLQYDPAILLTLTTHSTKSEGDYNTLLGDYDDPIAKRMYQKFRFAAVCNNCARLGIREKCPHQSTRLPSWQSERKKELTAWMLRHNKDDLDRELLGLSVGGTGRVFSENDVKRMFLRPRVVAPREFSAKHVFMFLDPNNGGRLATSTNKSDFAAISGYVDLFGNWVIMGMEAIRYVGPDEYGPLVDHVRKLRSFPYTKDATLIFSVESNTPDAKWVFPLIKEAAGRSMLDMSDPDRARDGLWTSTQKPAMVGMLRERLKADTIQISTDFFSFSKQNKELLDLYQKELTNYAERHRQPSDPTKPVVITYSGKDAVGGKDDLVMVTMFLVYYGHQFFTLPKWRAYR